jgi:hypothetical protein
VLLFSLASEKEEKKRMMLKVEYAHKEEVNSVRGIVIGLTPPF